MSEGLKGTVMFAIGYLDPTLYAVLVCVGFVLAVVVLAQSRLVSVLAWACTVVFFALAWNALAGTSTWTP
jgi:hypothetical protein